MIKCNKDGKKDTPVHYDCLVFVSDWHWLLSLLRLLSPSALVYLGVVFLPYITSDWWQVKGNGQAGRLNIFTAVFDNRWVPLTNFSCVFFCWGKFLHFSHSTLKWQDQCFSFSCSFGPQQHNIIFVHIDPCAQVHIRLNKSGQSCYVFKLNCFGPHVPIWRPGSRTLCYQLLRLR